jgi:hypothetical protein
MAGAAPALRAGRVGIGRCVLHLLVEPGEARGDGGDVAAHEELDGAGVGGVASAPEEELMEAAAAGRAARVRARLEGDHAAPELAPHRGAAEHAARFGAEPDVGRLAAAAAPAPRPSASCG